MKTVCEKNLCAGCMACVDICPKRAITVKDKISSFNAVIDETKCIDCDACHKVCQINHPANTCKPREWYQGWAVDKNVRANGSSGGFAGAIAEAFIDSGGVICSCVFKNGKFTFELTDRKEELFRYAGSKYVKSNPAGIYKSIRSELQNGKKVLMIALPCQISAAKNFIGDRLSNNFYTADLICHGTPSPKILNLFLGQYGYKTQDLSDIRFRIKGKFQVTDGYKGIITTGVTDRYLIAFLNSLTYTENCYSCQYAQGKRVSDVTLGDSWGTDLPADEFKRGVSLVLCQTDKGIELVKNANLHLEAVDLDKAIENNQQLQHPSVKPKGWAKFHKGIKEGKNFNNLVCRYLPKECAKQDAKELLIKTGLRKAVGGYGTVVKVRQRREAP